MPPTWTSTSLRKKAQESINWSLTSHKKPKTSSCSSWHMILMIGFRRDRPSNTFTSKTCETTTRGCTEQLSACLLLEWSSHSRKKTLSKEVLFIQTWFLKSKSKSRMKINQSCPNSNKTAWSLCYKWRNNSFQPTTPMRGPTCRPSRMSTTKLAAATISTRRIRLNKELRSSLSRSIFTQKETLQPP